MTVGKHLHVTRRHGESGIAYSSGGTHKFTLTTKLASLPVDIGQIVLKRYRPVRTLTQALSTTDTCRLASFHGQCAAVGARASHPHPQSARAFAAKLDDATGTSTRAGSASRTQGGIDDRQSGHWIHSYGIPLTHIHTITFAEATVGTSGGSDT